MGSTDEQPRCSKSPDQDVDRENKVEFHGFRKKKRAQQVDFDSLINSTEANS